MSQSTQQAIPEDLDAVKAWFRELAEHVQAVDFAAARHLFAADFVAFGTFTDFMIGRDLAENNQWRNVWPTIDSFVWRLDDAKALVSPDRLFAVGGSDSTCDGAKADEANADARMVTSHALGA
jgi:ketosteroid isomerase-like protein